jgi:hypothetical protein
MGSQNNSYTKSFQSVTQFAQKLTDPAGYARPPCKQKAPGGRCAHELQTNISSTHPRPLCNRRIITEKPMSKHAANRRHDRAKTSFAEIQECSTDLRSTIELFQTPELLLDIRTTYLVIVHCVQVVSQLRYSCLELHLDLLCYV